MNLDNLSKEELLELVKMQNQELEQMDSRLQEQTKRLEEKDQQLAQQASTITGYRSHGHRHRQDGGNREET